MATHRLLDEAGVHSHLLVTLDADTARLGPQVTPAGPPQLAVLRRVLAGVAEAIRAERAEGAPSELLLFYSGHGDIEHGEGHLVLEDGKLTRSALYDEILAVSPADTNHVIIDACKSYFMAFEKGAGEEGVERAPYDASFARHYDPSRAAHTGFVLSTSSARDSHEWERYGAGVFSHQVRSALRGGADVDADGQVTYAELGAFLATANARIGNRRYRPDFLVRPPGAGKGDLSRPVLRWGDADTVVLDTRPGHVYVEDASGERLADVHPAKDVRRLVLRLPARRPLFIRDADDRGEVVVAQEGSAALSTLRRRRPGVARKGALHLAFEELFATPFGRRHVDAYVAGLLTAEPATATRLTQAVEDPGTAATTVAGWICLAAAAAAGAGGGVLTYLAYDTSGQAGTLPQVERIEANRRIELYDAGAWGAFAGAAALTGAGLLFLLVDWDRQPSEGPGPAMALAPQVGGLSLVFRH